MFRFITHLMGRPFEECKSCETLKAMLDYERQNNQELINTILKITNPKVIEVPVQELKPVSESSMLFSRRRQVLEEKDRITADRLKNNKLLGTPDKPESVTSSVDDLERQLGISETE